MFAALALERDPFSYALLPSWVFTYLQNGGGFAAFGLAIWCLAYLVRRLSGAKGPGPESVLDPFGGFVVLGSGGDRSLDGLDRTLARLAPFLRRVFVAAVIAAAVVYGLLGLIKLPEFIGGLAAFVRGEPYTGPSYSVAILQVLWPVTEIGLAVGGFFALFAALLPFTVDLLRLRPRRLWALTKLTILEVIRRRVFYVFLLIAVVFLFGTWFIDSKPENQVRSYVQVVYLAIAILLLITGSLLAAFSLPNDIRQQTIQTVVTKPVERYEIFLGRLLGYSVVMTVALVVMAAFSLLYVHRGVAEEAKDESLKARVPVTGTLSFEGTDSATKGESVGIEWEYRGYIHGPMGTPGPPQYAIWSLYDLSPALARRDPKTDPVKCEFTFAIYRTTTGEINKGVFCRFTAASGAWDGAGPGELDAGIEEMNKERKKIKDEQRQSGQAQSDAEITDQLAKKYGLYDLPSKEVTNFHTQAFDLPVGLFRHQFRPREEVQKEADELRTRQKSETLGPAETRRLAALDRELHGDRPPLKIRIRCISRTQFVGMAKYDLYLLDRENWFWANFFRGAAGIWLWAELVLCVALACGTWLSGVISWIAVLFLFVVGWCRDFAEQVALGKNEGGGPVESMIRLFGKQNLATPLEHNTVSAVAGGSDFLFRWVMRRFIDVLPDVVSCDFSNWVANGFNVPGDHLTMAVLLLAGYLLLWLVLAYYLIKAREIAIPA
jgi:hypothetical protein